MLSWDEEKAGVGNTASRTELVGVTVDVFNRVNVADNRIINGKTDVNQLVPFKDKWIWNKYLADAPTTGCRRK